MIIATDCAAHRPFVPFWDVDWPNHALGDGKLCMAFHVVLFDLATVHTNFRSSLNSIWLH